MEIRIIRNINKRLNCLSIVTLLFGTLSILWTAQIASNIWAGITLSLIAIGLLSLLISWLLINFKTISISESQIKKLTLNSDSDITNINMSNDIEYLGNCITLTSGKKYEFDRTQIIKLKGIIQPDKIEIERTKQKFYNISPRELLKTLLNLGP